MVQKILQSKASEVCEGVLHAQDYQTNKCKGYYFENVRKRNLNSA